MLEQLCNGPHGLAPEFDLYLARQGTLNRDRNPTSVPGGRGRPIYRTVLFAMRDQGASGALAKTAGHPQHVNRLQHTGLATAIGAKKNVNARQILQRYLLQVPDMVDLELG